VAEIEFKPGILSAINYWTTVSTVAHNYEKTQVNTAPETDVLDETPALLLSMALRQGVIGFRHFEETTAFFFKSQNVLEELFLQNLWT
jgi:hypothetical protein